MFVPRLLHTSNNVFKKCASLVVFAPPAAKSWRRAWSYNCIRYRNAKTRQSKCSKFVCKDANCVAIAQIQHSYLAMMGTSRLGLGLKNRLETQFCEPRSRRLQVSVTSLLFWDSEYCKDIWLSKTVIQRVFSLLYLQVKTNENRSEQCEKFEKNSTW